MVHRFVVKKKCNGGSECSLYTYIAAVLAESVCLWDVSQETTQHPRFCTGMMDFFQVR